MKQDYAETDPEDTSTKEKIDTIADPDVQTVLLERMEKAEYVVRWTPSNDGSQRAC